MIQPDAAEQTPQPPALTRRQVLKTYTAPTIAIIGAGISGSFATSGHSVGRINAKAKTKGRVTATGKIPEKAKGPEKGKGLGK